MAKYQLIASNYNRVTGFYESETIVDLAGIDLSTLVAIDFYTASNKSEQIYKDLEKNGITGKNHLAIKYTNSEGNFGYLRIVEYNPNYVGCTNCKSTVERSNDGTYKPVLAITGSPELFENEWFKLETILKNNDIEAFNKRFPYAKSDLTHAVEIYINFPIEDETFYLSTIKNAFRNYFDFRKWYQEGVKQQRSIYTNSTQLVRTSPQNSSKQSTKYNSQDIPSHLNPYNIYTNGSNEDCDDVNYLNEQELEIMYGDDTQSEKLTKKSPDVTITGPMITRRKK